MRDGATDSVDEATELYLDERDLLFSLAYNLLGNVADSEDVLQDTWLSWVSAQRAEIANPRGYLVRIAVNAALARLRDAKRSRERYVGPWLPEPVVTDPDAVDSAVRGESLSLAVMVILETLTPLERAVFVLHEAFGYQHTEIAALLGRTPVAVRQLAHRARQHVRSGRPRQPARPQVVRAATQRFLDAALGADVDTLLEVLSPGVRLWSDGGGRRPAALRVIEGRAKVLRLVTRNLSALPALTVRPVHVNGEPAALLFAGATLYAVVVVELREDSDQVSGIYTILNPDKLAGVDRSGQVDQAAIARSRPGSGSSAGGNTRGRLSLHGD
ncbi:RNA polymerase sigma-70 factor (ECF subfamily) [Asanoa ferruginea]|uniref:RNA polymerase sigma-70 factor (ECF subfamily) n=1 Tax=Asanoa ferruginea TaxID=53367 RepID=A0A3D9ZUA6_9ACTN|nr:RNA polymerase sigma factor SigJ [Asanoa ferruginea]REG00969.1 RNA polymerase sigma-70 factor (ECF subfamily) [Asanoa ferruginea]